MRTVKFVPFVAAIVAALPVVASGAPRPVSKAKLAVASPAVIRNVISKEHGHVVMVNFWATWCGPCIAEFPDLVKTYNQLKNRGLVFVTISGDDPPSAARAALFLHERHAPAPSFIKPAGDIIKYAHSLDPHWDGSLPRTYLISKSGQISAVYVGRVDDNALRAELNKLLNEKAGPPHKQGKFVLAKP
jgi:thiol-disulfide isomerase/thioredoxin